jgi:hypothetical protein
MSNAWLLSDLIFYKYDIDDYGEPGPNPSHDPHNPPPSPPPPQGEWQYHIYHNP